MYQKIIHFIKYNNAFTLIVTMLFVGTSVSFAASPELRDSVYSSQETLVSVDNSQIVSIDLDSFNFNLRIDGVTDDQDNYYATYSYETLVIEDGAWQNRSINKTLKVNKESLEGRDLGLHLARELGENISSELTYLKKVQDIEKEKGRSQKVVTVEYSGLVGKLLDPEEKVIEGYSPVIPEPVKEIAVETPVTVESDPAAVILSTPYVDPPTPQPTTPVASTSPELPESSVPPVSSTTPAVPEEQPVPEQTPPPPPTPENMVDETLVQEVVEQFLEEQAIAEVKELLSPETEVVPEITQ